MKEHPIMFTAESVRAILAGRKTQTRRVFTQPYDGDQDSDGWPLVCHPKTGCLVRATPRYGAPGDRLWVREAFACVPTTGYRASEGVQYAVNPGDPDTAVVYRADWTRSKPSMWRSPLFMPRWASRITLAITSVRVERVQDISEADAQAEGWDFSNLDVYQTYDPVSMHVARQWYRVHWDAINTKRGYGWERNPWVWCLSFEEINQ